MVLIMIAKVKEVFNDFSVDQEITEESKLYELGISSIMILEIIVAFEEKYDFVFDDDDLAQDNFETVGSLMRLLSNYIK